MTMLDKLTPPKKGATKSSAGNIVKKAADCQSMAQVREGVDAIDRELVALLVKRQAYMKAAARIKPNREAVYDEARIEDVVSKVLLQARKAGLSEQIAEPVWRELIKQCIAHEFSVWDATRA